MSAFREQIETAIATAQRERDHWARQAEKLSELLEGGEPSPPEPKASSAGEPKPGRARTARSPGAPGQAAILAALEKQPGATAQEIAPELGIRPETVLGTLGKLKSARKVTATNTRPKRWSLAASAPSSPAPAPVPVRTSPAADEYFRGTSAQLRDALEVIEAEPEVGGEVVHRIEAALGESDVALTIHSLARAASCTSGAVVAALRRLRSDGRATELEPGKWRAASEPAADLVR